MAYLVIRNYIHQPCTPCDETLPQAEEANGRMSLASPETEYILFVESMSPAFVRSKSLSRESLFRVAS